MPSMRAVLEARLKAAVVRVEELEVELVGAGGENAAGMEDLSVDYRALMAAALEAGADGLGARRAAVVLD
ncbi:hypothetical protein M2162_000052 [Streptomyces sp. SAI-041]|nr:hypothetical protein [Streptomyces sp. SAI-041]